MFEDFFDVEGSNLENGGISGFDVLVKLKKKKWNFKEDQYDVDDDFVDDLEMLWEVQVVVSCDGFFVYFGLLVFEEQKFEFGYVVIFYLVFFVVNKFIVVRIVLSEVVGFEVVLVYVVDEVLFVVYQDQVFVVGWVFVEVLLCVSCVL